MESLIDYESTPLNEIQDRDLIKESLAFLGYSYNSDNKSLICSECTFAEFSYKNISLTTLTYHHAEHSPHCSNVKPNLHAVRQLSQNLESLEGENSFRKLRKQLSLDQSVDSSQFLKIHETNSDKQLHFYELMSFMVRLETFDKLWEDTLTPYSIDNLNLQYYLDTESTIDVACENKRKPHRRNNSSSSEISEVMNGGGEVSDVNSMIQVAEQWMQESSCLKCFDRKRYIVCMPCSHLAVCKQCSKFMRTCPMCEKPFEATIEVKFF